MLESNGFGVLPKVMRRDRRKLEFIYRGEIASRR